MYKSESDQFFNDILNSEWFNSPNKYEIAELFINNLNDSILIGNIFYNSKINIESSSIYDEKYLYNPYHFHSNSTCCSSNTSYFLNEINLNPSYDLNDNINDFWTAYDNSSSENEKISNELFLKFKSIKNDEIRRQVFDTFMNLFDYSYSIKL